MRATKRGTVFVFGNEFLVLFLGGMRARDEGVSERGMKNRMRVYATSLFLFTFYHLTNYADGDWRINFFVQYKVMYVCIV